MRRFKPTLWLAFGLASLTVLLMISAHSLGLMPDEHRAQLDARAKVAEALAVQVAGAAGRNDEATLKDTFEAVVVRNEEVLSVGLRLADGTMGVVEGDHEAHWTAAPDGKSTPTHVNVPLTSAEGPQGQIEIAFAPLPGGHFYGMPLSLIALVAFVAGAGFVGYFFLLRRTLKQLDPGRVVPERVQRAFDTLSEGVAILDERERILLANDAFARIMGGAPKVGTDINRLSWRMPDGKEKDGGYVWHTAIRERREMREEQLALRTADGTMHNLAVGAAVITGEHDETIGAIVTIGDVTRLKRSQEDLAKIAGRLAEREAQMARQTRELEYLTTHDTLSGCLNRRTFLSRLERHLGAMQGPVSLLVVEIEAFHDIADAHGPAVTDRMVAAMGALLRDAAPQGALVARHRGEEFVVSFDGDGATADLLAHDLRERVAAGSADLLPGHEGLGLAIGIGSREAMGDTAYHLIRRADRALGTHRRAATLPVMTAANEADATDGKAEERAFDHSLHAAIARAERSEQPLAIVRLRVASWDYLREALGESLTATLMADLGDKTRATLRGNDASLVVTEAGEIVSHFSEFEEPADLAFAVSRLSEILRRPVTVGGRDVYVSHKVGAAIFPGDGRDASTLLAHAGIAVRRALEDDVDEAVRFYDASMVQAAEWRMNVESGIREALANDQFELFFQPIVCARTQAVAAAEALLRCNNERLTGMRIDRIIAVAEQSNLSEEIDEWVIRRGLKQMHDWCDVGLQLPKVSLNVSARQLSNPVFMDRIFEAIREVRFSPSRVQIEVTETAKLADVEIAAPQLKRLQELGVQIALDDFGTGQASLTYLQRLHPDTLKIDRSFVNGITINHANATLVAAMTVMSQSLGVKVVVEGVEDREQLDFLRETGCDELQGYFFSKPMATPTMTQWLDDYVRENGAKPFVTDLAPAPIGAGEFRPGPAGTQAVAA